MFSSLNPYASPKSTNDTDVGVVGLWSPVSISRLDQTPIEGLGQTPWVVTFDGHLRFPKGVATAAKKDHIGSFSWTTWLIFLGVGTVSLVLTLFIPEVYDFVPAGLSLAASLQLWNIVQTSLFTTEQEAEPRKVFLREWRITPEFIESSGEGYADLASFSRFHRQHQDEHGLHLMARRTVYTLNMSAFTHEERQRLTQWIEAQVPPAYAELQNIEPPKTKIVSIPEADLKRDSVIGRGDLTRWELARLAGMTRVGQLMLMGIVVFFNLILSLSTFAVHAVWPTITPYWFAGFGVAVIVQWGYVLFGYLAVFPGPDPASGLVVGSDGITVLSTPGLMRIHWSQISERQELNFGIVLSSEQLGIVIVVPPRLFANEDDRHRAEAIIRRHTAIADNEKPVIR